MSAATVLRRHHRLFLMDAARWVVPSQVVPTDEVTPKLLARLLLRNMPLRAMLQFRLAGAFKDLGVPLAPGIIQRRLLVRFGLELVPGAEIGGGLYIAHPSGCTLVASQMGENITVIGRVTFGYRGTTGWPSIGDDTFFGAGCCVLGGVHVGAGAQVGANAVVLHDVAPGSTVVGIPARPVGGAAPAPGTV